MGPPRVVEVSANVNEDPSRVARAFDEALLDFRPVKVAVCSETAGPAHVCERCRRPLLER